MTDEELTSKQTTLGNELRALRRERLRRALLRLADERIERIQELCTSATVQPLDSFEPLRDLCIELDPRTSTSMRALTPTEQEMLGAWDAVFGR